MFDKTGKKDGESRLRSPPDLHEQIGKMLPDLMR